MPAVVGLIVLAPGIAHCILGQSFRAAAQQLIPLVALAAFFASIKAFHFDAAFQLVHKTLYQVAIVVVAAVVNVGLILFLIPLVIQIFCGAAIYVISATAMNFLGLRDAVMHRLAPRVR